MTWVRGLVSDSLLAVIAQVIGRLSCSLLHHLRRFDTGFAAAVILWFILVLQVFFRVLVVLEFDYGSLRTIFGVEQDVLQVDELLTEPALGERVLALEGVVLDLVLLENSRATSLANHSDEIAFVQLMCAQKQLVVSQLVRAIPVGTPESYLLQVLLLQFVDCLQGLHCAFAGSGVEFSGIRRLPPFDARCAKITFTTWAFLALDNDVVAKAAGEVSH